jgi:hypothetical protein
VYRITTYPEALEQIAALPAEALSFYAEVFGVLEVAPFLEREREVHVLLVQWVG